VRLFLAFELSERVKEGLQVAQRRLAEFDRCVRWLRPEQMHLTVKFLGEVPDSEVEAVCAAAGEVAAGSAPFTMETAGFGCFPPRGRVRIVHAPVVGETRRLERSRDLCEEVLAGLGFAREERAFSPHLTVGRVKEDRTNGRLRQAVETIRPQRVSQDVGELFVVQSVLSRGGAEYANIARHKLCGTA